MARSTARRERRQYLRHRVGVAAQDVAEIFGAWAHRGIGGEAAFDHDVKRWWNGRLEAARRRDRLVELARDELGERRCEMRRAPGEQLVEHGAEGVDVGRG